jgi:hypothetical protein
MDTALHTATPQLAASAATVAVSSTVPSPAPLATPSTPAAWTPASAEDRALIHGELDAILASYHFRTSKRYPALLRYIVDAALDGRTSSLKERTLGIEVFGRTPNYDTNADPVVRFSAGEVRKRIAQYYHENDSHSPVQIELPLGSYVPEFIFRSPSANGAVQAVAPALAAQPHNSHRLRYAAGACAALLFLAAGLATFWYRGSTAKNVPVVNKLWGPFLKSSGEVLIVVGPVRQETTVPRAENTGVIDNMTGRYDQVSVLSAVALAHLAGVLQQYGRPYEVKEATEASLADMRSRPIILIGAVNNTWTMDIVHSLPFRFVYDGTIARIQDTRNPQSASWSVDLSDASPSVTTDYAIVARFHDATTEGPVLVIAGLGPNGTEAASEFAYSPQYLAQIAGKAPAGWENKNLEMVLKVDVIGSKAGPPAVIAATVW